MQVLADGVLVGSAYRGDAKNVTVALPSSMTRLDLLVENCGRVNYGRELVDDRKGLLEPPLDGTPSVTCLPPPILGDRVAFYKTRKQPRGAALLPWAFTDKERPRHLPGHARPLQRVYMGQRAQSRPLLGDARPAAYFIRAGALLETRRERSRDSRPRRARWSSRKCRAAPMELMGPSTDKGLSTFVHAQIRLDEARRVAPGPSVGVSSSSRCRCTTGGQTTNVRNDRSDMRAREVERA